MGNLPRDGLLWFVFHTVSGVASLEVQFLAYLAVPLPLVGILVSELVPRPVWLGRAERLSSAARDRH